MLEAHVASQGDQRQPISEGRGNEAGDLLIRLVRYSFTDQIPWLTEVRRVPVVG